MRSAVPVGFRRLRLKASQRCIPSSTVDAPALYPVRVLLRRYVLNELRPYASLGGANYGWLDAKHHFSFANQGDSKREGWGNLRARDHHSHPPESRLPPP